MKSIFLQPGYDPGVGIPGFDGNEEILAVPEIKMWAAVSIWKGVHVNLISYIRCAFRIIHLSTAMCICASDYSISLTDCQMKRMRLCIRGS